MKRRIAVMGCVAAASWAAAACALTGAHPPAPSAPAAERAAPPAPADSGTSAVLPLPVVFYTPATRLAVGAAVVHTFRPRGQTRPTVSGAEFIYTQNRQVAALIGTDVHAGPYRIYGLVGHKKFPNRFFGIGNDTDVDEEYTSRATSVEFGFEKRVLAPLYLGVSYLLERSEMLEVEEGGLLAGGAVLGSRGGILSGAGLALTFDTRDDIIAPGRGAYARLHVQRFDDAFGGDYDFTRLDLDLRRYVPTRPGHVLALQGVVRSSTEGAPFHALAQLGGPCLLRGFRDGRFRDRHLVATQVEYRMPLWWRFGLAGFAGAGQVAGAPADLSFDRLHLAAGVGLRLRASGRNRLNLRLDFGYARGASGLYITAGEAF
ncbi:MAG TPA: BamA/TamA family outer membrane protein [Longimicrobiales bacterium]